MANHVFNKQDNGTIHGWRYENGIGLGIYGKGRGACWLERDEKRNCFVLRINRENCDANSIVVEVE